MKYGAILGVIAAVVLVAGGAWWLFARNDTDVDDQQASTSQAETEDEMEEMPANEDELEDESDTEPASTITYTDSGFDVSLSNLQVGSSVLVVNNSSGTLEFSSDPHPQHTDNYELNVPALAPGEQKVFVITEPGTWGFHNHLNDSHSGSITVTTN